VGNDHADVVAVAHALTSVVAKSFDGDVRTLRPVPSKQDERDWEEKLILPPLPIGPANRIAPAVTIPAGPMPTPIQNFEGVARLDTGTGGQLGGGFPPDINGEVGLNDYIIAVNTVMPSTTRQPARDWRHSQKTRSFPAARRGRCATPIQVAIRWRFTTN